MGLWYRLKTPTTEPSRAWRLADDLSDADDPPAPKRASGYETPVEDEEPPRPLPSPARGASSAAEARPAGESRIASRPPASPSNRPSAARRAVGEAATAASYYIYRE